MLKKTFEIADVDNLILVPVLLILIICEGVDSALFVSSFHERRMRETPRRFPGACSLVKLWMSKVSERYFLHFKESFKKI